jgi:hypothetical protein
LIRQEAFDQVPDSSATLAVVIYLRVGRIPHNPRDFLKSSTASIYLASDHYQLATDNGPGIRFREWNRMGHDHHTTNA